ncbi:hypothetical protein J6590_092431 [Homalodisca vitripennis]|nr:hypothetical protein J6590_092431 [Homalodisca vitripennis]
MFRQFHFIIASQLHRLRKIAPLNFPAVPLHYRLTTPPSEEDSTLNCSCIPLHYRLTTPPSEEDSTFELFLQFHFIIASQLHRLRKIAPVNCSCSSTSLSPHNSTVFPIHYRLTTPPSEEDSTCELFLQFHFIIASQLHRLRKIAPANCSGSSTSSSPHNPTV